MPDIFDSLTLQKPGPKKRDIFDEIESAPAPSAGVDIFDQISLPAEPAAPLRAQPSAPPPAPPAAPPPAAAAAAPAPNASPAKLALQKAMDAATRRDAAGLEQFAAEALQLDPNLVEAQNLVKHLGDRKALGHSYFPAEPAAPAPVPPGPLENAAAAAAQVTRAALPVPSAPRLPRTPKEAVESALLPILSISAPLRSEEGQRMAAAGGAGVAGSAASMAAAVPALEAFAGIETPAGKIAQKAADRLGALAQDLMPDDPNFAELLASGAGSMALFMLPGTAAAGTVSAIPRMGVLAARLAPALGVGLPVVLESATEAGGVFQQALLAGKSREEAGGAAAKTFLSNAVLVGLTNRFGLDAQGRTALVKMLAAAPLEALQEAGQSIISALASGDPVDWGEVAVSAGVGGILGGALGGIRGDAPAPAAAPAVGPRMEISAGPGNGAPPARAAAGGPSPVQLPPPPSTPAAAGASSRLVEVMDLPSMEALAQVFPSVAKAAAAGPVPVPREVLAQAIQAAKTAGEATLTQTRDPMAADAAALEVFQQSTGMMPAPVAPAATPEAPAADIFDQIELPPEETAPAPPDAVPAEGARLTEPPRPAPEIPRETVLAHAKALHRAALQEREAKTTPLERFIIEQGGVKSIKREGEEFRAVPLHLRGPAILDEVEADARAAGLLGPNEDLYTAIQRLPRRGPRPAMTDFIDQARRELENEYEVYGPPEEGPRAAPREDEEVPFEEGPGYQAGGGSPVAQFIGYNGPSRDGKIKPLALFNVPAKSGDGMDTVGAEEVARRGIQVPEIPSYEDWEASRPPRGAGEKQPDLFGGAGPARGRPEAKVPGQQDLFGQMARPQFELPKPNAQARRLAATEEGRHQVPMKVPRALQESVVVKDLAEEGFLAVPKMRIDGPEDTAAIFNFLKEKTVESFYIVALDAKDKILGAELVSVGILDSTMVHPRDALKGATLLGAKKVVLIHNHPSGDPTPSRQDLALTKTLTKAAGGAGIEVKHHVVINDKKFGVIEKDGRAEVREREGALPEGREKVRLVKPKRSGAATGKNIQNSAAAVEFAKSIQEGSGGVIVLALDTKLRPAGAWYMGDDYLGVDAMAAEVGKIAMRNNAHSVIFAGARMPKPDYIRAIHAELESTWSVPLLDVTAFGSPGTSGVESARDFGLLRDEASPYDAESRQPGAKPEDTLRAVKRVEKAQARELERARLPSRQGMPPRYTEAQALRVALQREAKAAAAAWTRAKQESEYELRYRIAEAEKITDIEAGRARAEGKEEGLAQGRRMSRDARARGQREGAYSQRWFEAERNRIRTDLATQVEGLLPPEERGRFIRAVATAQTPKDLAKAAVRMDQALARVQKKALIGRIKRNFDRVVASKAIAVDYVGKVRGLMSDVLLTKPRAETLRRAAETQRVIDQARAGGQRVDVPQYVLDKIKALSSQPLIDLPVAKVEDLLDQIKRLADLGKTKLEAMQAIDSAQKEADMADLMAGSEPITSREEARPLPGEELPVSERAANVLRRSYNRLQNAHYAITPMDVVFDVLDGNANFAGPNYRIFKARVDNAFGNYLQEAARLRDEARAKARALGLTEKSMERIGVYAIDVQEGGRQKLYNSGLSDEEIEGIRLTPAENAFYRYMRQNLEGLRPRIADTMRRVYNAELGQVPNYFPFVTDWDQMSEQELRDRMLTEMTGLRKNPEQGFTKKRVGPGRQKVDLNALDVYLKHVDDAAYLVNVGPEAKYLGELASSDQYQAVAGNVGQRIVREWVDTIARKGGGFGDQQIRILDFLRRNVGLAALGLRATSAAVQPTAILQGGALVGPRVFQGMADLAGSRGWRKFILESFPELRERAGDDIAFLDFNGEGARDKFGRMVMWPLQKLDILAARSVAAGAFRKYMADKGISFSLDDEGQLILPDEKAIQVSKDAIDYAERVVRRTQSTSSFKDAPQALTRGRLTGNRSLDRALLQFQSFILNNWSLLTHEGVRAGAAKGNVTQAANVALWSVMAVMAATGIRGGVRELLSGQDDDRDYWKEVAKDFLSNVPFVSNVMAAFYGREMAPGVDVLRRGISGGARMVMGRRPETRERGAMDLVGAASTLTPFPIPSQVIDLAKAAAGGSGAGRQAGARTAAPRTPRSRAVIVR